MNSILQASIVAIFLAACSSDDLVYDVSDENVTAAMIQRGKMIRTEKRVCFGIANYKYCFPRENYYIGSGEGVAQGGPAGVLLEFPLGPLDDECNPNRKIIDIYTVLIGDDHVPTFENIKASGRHDTVVVLNKKKHLFNFTDSEIMACSSAGQGKIGICAFETASDRGRISFHLPKACLDKAPRIATAFEKYLIEYEVK